MRFWDSSALAPLVVEEPTSAKLRGLADDGRRIVVWWAAAVEVVAAVGQRERSGDLDSADASVAVETLAGLAGDWSEVPPTGVLRIDAMRLVRVHGLRAADALQLAAARAASGQRAQLLPFVTLDDRLAVAAGREGFAVLL